LEVVARDKASTPIATFWSPVVFVPKELKPNAVLQVPSVLSFNAL
jgi:hypothetical protein